MPTATTSSATLVDELKPAVMLGLRALRMDRDALKEIAAQQGSLKVPAILFAVSSVAFGIGFLPHVTMMLTRPIMLLALMGTVHALARSQGGQANFATMFRIASHLFILDVAGIIPGVGLLLMLVGTAWYLWILVGALEEIYGLEQQPAMRVVGIAVVALIALGFVGSIVDGAIRGASKDSSLAPGALAPNRPGLNEVNP